MLNLKVGNDNGNSEHCIIINGDMIKQVNVNCKISRLPNLENLNKDYVIKNINDNLIATIESKSLNNGTPTTYYVGNYATKTGKMLKNIEVGARNSKVDSDIPLINTLSQIAGYAIKETYNNKIKHISVNVDMTTSLPITQYNKTNTKIFIDKFIGKHIVTIYIGDTNIKVNINFEYIKVLPEAVPTVFYLKSSDIKIKKDILSKYIEDYNIKNNDIENISFDNKRILHVSIGEGTTEYPLTEDINFNPHFIIGSNNGVGHAINAILQDFISDKSLSKLSRQDFSNILKDKFHKYHDDAMNIIQDSLEEQSTIILDLTKQMISKANNNIDYICVYGGGSILMEKYFKNKLKEFADKTNIEIIYLPQPYSTDIEALGLYKFTESDIFKNLKLKYFKDVNYSE